MELGKNQLQFENIIKKLVKKSIKILIREKIEKKTKKKQAWYLSIWGLKENSW